MLTPFVGMNEYLMFDVLRESSQMTSYVTTIIFHAFSALCVLLFLLCVE